VLIALPLTLIVMGAGAMFFGTSASGAFRFSFNFGVTALISVAITALGHMIHTSNRPALLPEVAPVSVEPAVEPNRFTARLPLPMQTVPIVALEAEDHYLRVHLQGGRSTLILMRLSDAIAELPADKGAQTHRSWWVAKDAVRGVAKADGRATLTLDGGIEAPVSRSYYKLLSDAGWLS
jgi:DNA-binding LytR/AlgR family response regulator